MVIRMVDDTLQYLDNMIDKFSKLNTTVITEVIIDEDKMAEKVAEKMKRDMSGKTSEGIGGWS